MGQVEFKIVRRVVYSSEAFNCEGLAVNFETEKAIFFTVTNAFVNIKQKATIPKIYSILTPNNNNNNNNNDNSNNNATNVRIY